MKQKLILSHRLLTYLLLISLLFGALSINAQTDFSGEISGIKQQPPSSINRRAIEVRYSLWARQLLDQHEDLAAAKVYEQAVADPYLTDDQHANLAIELAALYNKQLLYKTSYDLLQRFPLSDRNKQSWRWTMRLAQTELYRKNYEEALLLFNTLADQYPQLMNSIELPANRGFAYMALGQWDKAVNDLERAMRMSKEPEYQLLSLIALLHATQGNYTQAVKDINEALLLAGQQTDVNKHDILVLYRKRAEIELAMADSTAAMQDFTLYWQGEREYICHNFANMTEQQRLDYWANRKPLVSEAFALENKAPRMLADLAIFRHQAALLPPRASAEQQNQIHSRLNFEVGQVQEALHPREWAMEMVKYKRDGEYRYAAILIPSSKTNSTDTVRFIPMFSQDTINNFKVGNKRLLEALCSVSHNDKNNIYSSLELTHLVWDKILSELYRDPAAVPTDLYFAPDGIFNLLAIEYLPGIDTTLNLHRLSSTAVLPERRLQPSPAVRSQEPLKALLIGGLDYDYLPETTPDSLSLAPLPSTPFTDRHAALHYWIGKRDKLAYFTYLPGSKQEVDSIALWLDRWDKTYDETEEQLKAEFADFDLVHLSTHGYSLQVEVPDPDEFLKDTVTTDFSLDASGLALSGANITYRHPDREDGMLTAREISLLDLSRVKFVVTSSCQSAQGVVSDEGPASLVRGLKLAGVSTIMASLWPVDDRATTILMQLFYEEWQSGQGKDRQTCTKTQALRRAQQRLQLLGNKQHLRRFNAAKMRGEYETIDKSVYRMPYYWAPFILIDDVE